MAENSHIQITYIKFYRLYAIIASVLTLLLYVFHIFYPDFEQRHIFYIHISIIIFCLICFIILIFKPQLYKVFIFVHLCMSFNFIFAGQAAIGLLIYYTGCLSALSFGFFKDHFKIKMTFTAVFMYLSLTPLIFFYPIQKFLEGLLIGTFLSIIFIFYLILLASYLDSLLPKAFLRKDEKPSCDLFLADYNFTDKELFCIKGVIEGTPYKAIASDLSVSESVVKKIMCRIFLAFKVDTRERLVATLATYNVIFPNKKE